VFYLNCGENWGGEFSTGTMGKFHPALTLETNGNFRKWRTGKILKRKAGDGDRTRDVQLGKLAFYR
jgi:hypothetical protein